MLLAGGKGERLHPLTAMESKPAVPFGGIYRIIDFTLSNCISSGIRRIFVLTQYRSHTLHRHLQLGWSFLSHYFDEFIEAVPPQQMMGESWYRGTADAIYQNLHLVQQYGTEDILIVSGDHIYKMDYSLMWQIHKDRKADLTIATIEYPIAEGSSFGIMAVDCNDRVTGFQEKPKNPTPTPTNPNHCLVNMGVYLFKKEVLIDLLEKDSGKTTAHDFGKDIIPSIINTHAVYSYNFRDENNKTAKYWRDVGTMKSYFDTNMDLISTNPELNLYDPKWPIRTLQEQSPPPKFVFADLREGRVGIALDSMVAAGCIISGGRVQNCILSPWVRVNSYAEVTRCILFHEVNIGRYSKVRNCIIDRGVVLPPRTVIGYDLEEDTKRFTVTEDGIVVVPRTWKPEPE